MSDAERNGATGSSAAAGDAADEAPAAAPSMAEARARFHSVGVPTERSKDFGGTASRLGERLRPERLGVAVVIALAVVSVVMVVLGPRLNSEKASSSKS